ncbi:hypothetical protein D5687_10880 [Guyparkeria sp. SCN-R1]|nr:hypothetical protein D5687_10880 [Guyparkeria sp. SCN-R1]
MIDGLLASIVGSCILSEHRGKTLLLLGLLPRLRGGVLSGLLALFFAGDRCRLFTLLLCSSALPRQFELPICRDGGRWLIASGTGSSERGLSQEAFGASRRQFDAAPRAMSQARRESEIQRIGQAG